MRGAYIERSRSPGSWNLGGLALGPVDSDTFSDIVMTGSGNTVKIIKGTAAVLPNGGSSDSLAATTVSPADPAHHGFGASLDIVGCSFTVPLNVTIDCTDSCSGTATNFVDTFAASCGGAGTITRVDTSPPSFVPPADLTVDCSDPTTPATTGLPTVPVDDCSSFTTNITDTFTANCGGAGTLSRVWQLVDACGNGSGHTQFITIVDTTAPTFMVPPSITLLVGDPTTPAATGTAGNYADDCGTPSNAYNDQFATSKRHHQRRRSASPLRHYRIRARVP